MDATSTRFAATAGLPGTISKSRPTKEVQYLSDNFHFHTLALDDVLSKIQRPKVDDYDTYLFIVLHFPVFDKTNRVTTPSELNIFIGENFLITSHKGDLKPLSKLFNECLMDEEIRQKYMGRSASFLFYQILDRLVNYCFPILDRIEDNIDKIEDLIFTRAVPETVREISMIRRDLISFRRIIHPQIVGAGGTGKGEISFLQGRPGRIFRRYRRPYPQDLGRTGGLQGGRGRAGRYQQLADLAPDPGGHARADHRDGA